MPTVESLDTSGSFVVTAGMTELTISMWGKPGNQVDPDTKASLGPVNAGGFIRASIDLNAFRALSTDQILRWSGHMLYMTTPEGRRNLLSAGDGANSYFTPTSNSLGGDASLGANSPNSSVNPTSATRATPAISGKVRYNLSGEVSPQNAAALLALQADNDVPNTYPRGGDFYFDDGGGGFSELPPLNNGANLGLHGAPGWNGGAGSGGDVQVIEEFGQLIYAGYSTFGNYATGGSSGADTELMSISSSTEGTSNVERKISFDYQEGAPVVNDENPSVINAYPAHLATVSLDEFGQLDFGWIFSHPYSGISQAAWEFRRDLLPGQGIYEYWNATTNLWSVTPFTNVGAIEDYTFPVGAWQEGVTYDWSVRVTDDGVPPLQSEWSVPTRFSITTAAGQSQFAWTDYTEDGLLNAIFNGIPFAPPANVYLGLFITPTSDDGSGTEVAALDYARQAVSFAAATGGVVQNDVAISFTPLTNWGSIIYIALFDLPAGGNMLAHGPLSEVKDGSIGQVITFAPNELSVTAD